jgi:hypothetical protein
VVLTARMPSAPLDPPEWPSERALGRAALRPLFFVGLWCLLLLLHVVSDDDRDAFWSTVVVVWSLLIAVSTAKVIGDVKAVRAWRRLPAEGDERMIWGTSAQFVLPTGGAGHGGVFALSTTRLRYAPRWFARLRGVHAQEWPRDALGPVSVQPYDGRRRVGGGRWVVLDVVDQPSIVILNTEQHLVAADLHTALSAARAEDPVHPVADPS